MWGCASSITPAVPLNYAALDKALRMKAAANRGRTDRAYLYQRYVYAHRKGNAIALRLHQTDIVLFHPNGEQTLDANGWASARQTRDWFNHATQHLIRAQRFGAYGRMQTTWGPYLYYNGMRVHGQRVLSEVRWPVKYVLNAEGKALRKAFFAGAQVYRRMWALDSHMPNPDIDYPDPNILDNAVHRIIEPEHTMDMALFKSLAYISRNRELLTTLNQLLHRYIMENSAQYLTEIEIKPQSEDA